MMKKIDVEESRTLGLLLTFCDIVLICLCLISSYAYYATVSPSVIKGVDIQTYVVVAILCYLPLPMLFPLSLFERTARGDKIVSRAFRVTLTHIFLVFGVLFLLKEVAIARILLVTFALSFWILFTLERLLFLHSIRHFRSRGRNTQHVVLVGNTEEMEELYDYMCNREYGYNVVGVFTDGTNEIPGIPVLGSVADVLSYLKSDTTINAVYSTMDQMTREELVALYKYCENNLIRFYALPMYLSYLRRNMRISHIGSTILLTARSEPLRLFENRLIKRLFDLVISGLFLMTAFPVIYVIAAIIIKRQSPGPVIFVQRRNGLNGQVFNCYKFRSMRVNSEADTRQALPGDDRTFPFGSFMRRTNIDELPQFINVFLGDMSLVGPRPHMLMHTEEYSHIINKYMVRHWVKPGITGWAQVNGFRGETRDVEQMERRVQADIWYVENWTFWLDVRIVWRTFINSFHSDPNAY